MTPIELLALLRAQADVRLVDGQLEIAAPRGVLSPELRTEVVWQKHELVVVLEAEARAEPPVEVAADLMVDDCDMGCQHPHVVISDGVLECQRCDMRRRIRPAEEGDAWDPLESTCRHASLSIL